jgi:hypothetical protein
MIKQEVSEIKIEFKDRLLRIGFTNVGLETRNLSYKSTNPDPMKLIFSFFLLFLISAKLSAQQDCYIQVKAEPNISVFLNEEFKGITNEEYSGLIIQKLKAGTYYIKVVKDGYEPQAEPVVLKTGEVKIYQVKPFIPKYRITQSGNKQQRTLELKTGNNIYQDDPGAYAASKTSFEGQSAFYDLGGRAVHRIATVKSDFQEEGKVVVEINVDRNGKVVQAVAGVKGSTTLNEYLLRVAREAALQSVFERNSNAPIVQKGTITYNFLLK